MGTGFADTSSPAATTVMLRTLTLTRTPGEGFEYCNTGPNTVSRVIEVLTGQDYDAFVANRIWSPLLAGHSTESLSPVVSSTTARISLRSRTFASRSLAVRSSRQMEDLVGA